MDLAWHRKLFLMRFMGSLMLFATFHRCSSFVFPLTGDVYPTGHYYVTMYFGQPATPYFLDIDTGSDLTWLQCDAPCVKCTPAPHSLYKPINNLVQCMDPLCVAFNGPEHHCEHPEDQCDYMVAYADQGSSIGVMVRDAFTLKLTDGAVTSLQLAFGCGYNQDYPNPNEAPFIDGVLGLGAGKTSITSQLSDLGASRKVVGHCLSARGGGFLFFGDNLVPPSGVAWVPLLPKTSEREPVSVGPADILFDGQQTGINGLTLVLDSGSTYSYFNTQAYTALLSLIKKDLEGTQLKDADEDGTLPVCWKGPEPFKTVAEAESNFKPIALSFHTADNVQMQFQPEAYLIVSGKGNVCLGILDGGEVGLTDICLIGDISMQDKMVIYDYENERIGWLQSDCVNPPKPRTVIP